MLASEWKRFERISQLQNFTLGTMSLSRLWLLKLKMKLSIFRDFSIPPLPAAPKSPALANEVHGRLWPWEDLPPMPPQILVAIYISFIIFHSRLSYTLSPLWHNLEAFFFFNTLNWTDSENNDSAEISDHFRYCVCKW